MATLPPITVCFASRPAIAAALAELHGYAPYLADEQAGELIDTLLAGGGLAGTFQIDLSVTAPNSGDLPPCP